MIIVTGFQPLTTITKSSTLDVAAVLYPPLIDLMSKVLYFKFSTHLKSVALSDSVLLLFLIEPEIVKTASIIIMEAVTMKSK